MQYDIFISYSRKDYTDDNGNVINGSIVQKIKDLLSENGISYWFDEDGISSGDEFAQLIANSIKNSKIMLFISSANSNKSEWTRKEIATAISLKKKIIPFKYDDAPFDDSVSFYLADLDFIEYNNEEKSFKRLLSSIKKYLNQETVTSNKQRISAFEKEKMDLENSRKLMMIEIDKSSASLHSLKEKYNATVDKINEIEKELCRLDKTREKHFLAKLDDNQEVKKTNKPKKNNGWMIFALSVVLIYAAIVTFMRLDVTQDEQEIVEEQQIEIPQLNDMTIKVNGVDFEMIAVNGNEEINDFYIGKFEVTQKLWKAVMGNTVKQQRDMLDSSLKLRGEADDMPMYYISWDDCQVFIKKLNSLTGKQFRLPLEAEWEYAAKGVGNDVAMYGWIEDNSNGSIHRVGQKKPNDFGLYDMIGNVSEWCSDKKGYERMVKGGDWSTDRGNISVSKRTYLDISIRSDCAGFRLAL